MDKFKQHLIQMIQAYEKKSGEAGLDVTEGAYWDGKVDALESILFVYVHGDGESVPPLKERPAISDGPSPPLANHSSTQETHEN